MRHIISSLLLIFTLLSAQAQLVTYYPKSSLPVESYNKAHAQELMQKYLKEEGKVVLNKGNITIKVEDVISYKEVWIRMGYLHNGKKAKLLKYLTKKGLDKNKIFEFLGTKHPVAIVSYKTRMTIITTKDYEFTNIIVKDELDPYYLLIDGKHLRKSNYPYYPYYIHLSGRGLGVNTENEEIFKF